MQPCELIKEPYNYTGWLIMDDVNILGAKVNDIGSGGNGRFEVPDYAGTPWGALSLSNVATNGRASDADFNMSAYPGTQASGNTLFRLREGIERFMITDINNAAGSAKAQSMVPGTWDHISVFATDFNHVPGGQNVLYMDGHVSCFSYPGTRFPSTPASARIFGRYNRTFVGLS